MVDDKTFTSLLEPTKPLREIRSHRMRTQLGIIRPVVFLLVLAVFAPLVVLSVLPQDAPRSPLSEPYSAETYAPLTFPAPPYVEPSEPRTVDVNNERASRAPAASAERKQPSKVEIVISFALAQVGKRYSFGSKGPNTYDCSGLLVAAFAQIGISMYHYTGEMMKYGVAVQRASLQRGDIVFPTASHVGIYLGGNQFVHASSGKGRVTVGTVYAFYKARRIV